MVKIIQKHVPLPIFINDIFERLTGEAFHLAAATTRSLPSFALCFVMQNGDDLVNHEILPRHTEVNSLKIMMLTSSYITHRELLESKNPTETFMVTN